MCFLGCKIKSTQLLAVAEKKIRWRKRSKSTVQHRPANIRQTSGKKQAGHYWRYCRGEG